MRHVNVNDLTLSNTLILTINQIIFTSITKTIEHFSSCFADLFFLFFPQNIHAALTDGLREVPLTNEINVGVTENTH